ncbi:Amidase [Cordyceps militaris CM01]|uniref:Amidase n=2 Tax=Cordyceps militaris TaxID=73501 RepID=G3J639_CORMM|nr:Amidase [Cordyceps militaris CM01]ATY63578.1 Amidase [Cordyceps militaris]EGX96143.1 Amidase [Cordyceps militaris CM01]
MAPAAAQVQVRRGGDDARTILNWSADETVAAIREKRISARRYITTVLEQAQRGASLNAFVTLLRQQALEAADKVDVAISCGAALPPLAGLAIVAKDNINLEGVATTGGTPALQYARPNNTAPSLRKLITAGAIVIGKANMHELAFGITSTNFAPFALPVHNPYAANMIPGGSSGGTAAAISSHVVPCGLGTDTGGSVRIPAALTGIVGFRPSLGDGGPERRYVDDDAVLPISHTRDTVGTMGRSVADVTLLDSIIAGQPRPEAANLAGVRLGVPRVLWTGLDKNLEQVVLKARQLLEQAGAVLVDADIPDLITLDNKISLPLALHEPRTDIPAYLKASGINNVTIDDIAQRIASPDVQKLFKLVTDDAFGGAYNDAITIHRPALKRLYADYFVSANVSAILFPTTPLPATPIDYTNGSGTVSINGGPPQDTFGTYISFTSPGSDAGIPGLSIPAGLTRSGLPVGIEIDGPLGSDVRLLSLGLAIEKILGRLPPPKLFV